MASKEIGLVVLPRGKPVKNLPTEVRLPRESSATELYQKLATAAGTSIDRLRVTKGSDGNLVPNRSDVTIVDTGLMADSKIYVKDLGPQIAWKTVFLVEYIGPLLFHPLIYYLRPYIYSAPDWTSFPPPSDLQNLSLILVCIHFAKREIETLLIHRFSSATMPVQNIFKNSFHYWILAGLNMAYWIYRPDAPTAQVANPTIMYTGRLLFLVGELGNLNAHITLRRLRSDGGKERGIPEGTGFDIVTCPNYTFETMAWVGICMVTWSLSTVLFALVSIGQMAVWAKKKEKNYRREFGDRYQRKIYTMIPFVW